MPPSNRDPTVATSRPSSGTQVVAANSATSGAGTRCVNRGQTSNTAIVATPTATSAGCALGRARVRAVSFSGHASGRGPALSPRKSEAWRVAITTAMPAVKPVVTG